MCWEEQDQVTGKLYEDTWWTAVESAGSEGRTSEKTLARN